MAVDDTHVGHTEDEQQQLPQQHNARAAIELPQHEATAPIAFSGLFWAFFFFDNYNYNQNKLNASSPALGQ